MKINPMMIAAIGGLVVFFLWNQRRTQMAQPAVTPQLAPPPAPAALLEYGDVGEETYAAGMF